LRGPGLVGFRAGLVGGGLERGRGCVYAGGGGRSCLFLRKCLEREGVGGGGENGTDELLVWLVEEDGVVCLFGIIR